MKDRIVALFGALAALYVFVVIFIHPPGAGPVEQSHATSEDTGAIGLKSLYAWLEQSNVPVYQLRRRYDALDQPGKLAATGNLLVVTLPQVTRARDKELEKLRAWVGRGNNLLLLLALSDYRHEPLAFSNYFTANRYLEPFGFQVYGKPFSKDEIVKQRASQKKKKSGKAEAKHRILSLKPIGATDITRGIKHIFAEGPKNYSPSYKLASVPFNRASLTLLKNQQQGDPAFWEFRYENSRIWVSQFAYLFGNRELAHANNARLAANLVGASLTGNGKVIFDDMHQGSTELYDQAAFFHDSRLLNSVWFVFAFWLLYVVGHTNRIAPIVRPASKARVADFVTAMANLFARRLSRVASAKLLFSQFFDWVRLKYGMPTNGQPTWQLLERTERINKEDLAVLMKNYAEIQKNRKVNLVKLVNRMQKIRSTIS